MWLRGGVVTGADGFLVADPLQYLDWSRQAGEHGLIGNRHDLAPGDRAFLHPGLLLSGLAWRLGAGPAVAYLLWKPVAVGVLFAGTLVLVRRFLARPDDRRLALVLALFSCSPVAALVGWGGLGDAAAKLQVDFVTGELWSGSYLWGYLFTAIAVGLLPLGLVAYERGRAGGGGRLLAAAAGAGLLCAWLQPWQGATFAFVIAGAEAVELVRGRRGAGAPRTAAGAARDLALPLAATAAPLVYYALLGHFDAGWALAAEVNDLPRWAWWALLGGLAPLAIPAAFAYRLPAPDFGAVALRAWPLAALARLLPAVRHVPVPCAPGTHAAARGPGRARAAGVAGRAAGAARAGGGRRPGARGRRDRVPRREPRRRRARRPAAVHADGGRARRAAPPRRRARAGRRARPGLHRDRRAGVHGTRDLDRRRIVDAGPAGARPRRRRRCSPAAWTPPPPRRSCAARARASCSATATAAPTSRGLLAGFTDPPRRFGCATVWSVRG